MILTNNQIFKYAQDMINFLQDKTIYIPAKTNFYIQKNIKTLQSASADIDEARIKIAEHYGTYNQKDNIYIVEPSNIDQASKEMDELFALSQDLDIKPIKLSELDGINFTTQQMQTLMFMIEE